MVDLVAPAADRRDRLDSYTSVRDAYSRIGVKGEYPLSSGLVLSGELQLPIDSANLRVRVPVIFAPASKSSSTRSDAPPGSAPQGAV